MIHNHDRSLVTDLAAANHFTPDHLQKPENWEIVEKAGFYYIGGFHLTVSPPAIKLLGEHASKTNKPLVLNFLLLSLPNSSNNNWMKFYHTLITSLPTKVKLLLTLKVMI